VNQANFERYLEFRFQKAGALTPGQKVEVVRQLIQEARQGRVPSGEKAVISLPVDHPAVAAVLRGEEVSIGATTIRRSGADWRDVASWPLAARLGVLAGIFVLIVLLGLGMMRGRVKAEETEITATVEASPTATAEATSTPDWYATMTALAPTPAPPPTATASPAAFLLGAGAPADESRDPASIEIAGRLFVVSAGSVGEDGTWAPDGPQWLKGTEVRRVFAIPYDSLADVQVKAGDPIYVRTRGGQVITYLVRDVVRLLANQIESFVSLRPSLVVALPMQPGDVQSSERVVLFGEAQADTEVSAVEEAAAEYVPNAFTLGAANLRDNPGLKSAVLIGMPQGTPLIVSAAPPVTVDGHVWVYVLSPYGYGWVAKDVLFIQP
jgi:hypothetical protein